LREIDNQVLNRWYSKETEFAIQKSHIFRTDAGRAGFIDKVQG
jgi:hypothetical protein